MRLIVDASLMFKTFVAEAQSDAAAAFFHIYRDTLDAPDLLLVELGNSLVRLVNMRELQRAEAERGIAALSVWERFGIRLHRVTPDLATDAARLAIDLGHPIADCVYLALADRLGCPLATCDVKFRDRVADPARVRLLSELV